MNETQLVILEAASMLESTLNLYIQAKRDLNAVHGFVADVTAFPVVVNGRQTIREMRAYVEKIQNS